MARSCILIEVKLTVLLEVYKSVILFYLSETFKKQPITQEKVKLWYSPGKCSSTRYMDYRVLSVLRSNIIMLMLNKLNLSFRSAESARKLNFTWYRIWCVLCTCNNVTVLFHVYVRWLQQFDTTNIHIYAFISSFHFINKMHCCVCVFISLIFLYGHISLNHLTWVYIYHSSDNSTLYYNDFVTRTSYQHLILFYSILFYSILFTMYLPCFWSGVYIQQDNRDHLYRL